MQESIRKIIAHKYTNDKGSLVFSKPRLEIALHKNEKASGSVEVVCHQAEEFRGYVYSSYYRMQCEESRIRGERATIHYCFESEGMEPGEVIRGEICLVSNLGQYFLPFQVSIVEETMDSSLGKIKNLFHFVNLAKTNWDEAVKIFYSENFASILTGADRQYLAAYRGLSKYKYNEQNMDEFLLLTNKKQKIQFTLGEDSASFDTIVSDKMGQIEIEKNGWGYVNLSVSAVGDFIELPKEHLSEGDFLGNKCVLSYYIDAGKLHGGNNFAKILIKDKSEILEFMVTVSMKDKSGRAAEYRREKKAFMLQTMDAYLRFRTKKITSKEWLAQGESIIERMGKFYTNSIIVRLYQTQILLAKDRPNEAKWILNHVENMFENTRPDCNEYAYYLYLTSMYEKNDEATASALKQIRTIYEKDTTNFRVYWLLLYLDENLRADKERVYGELKQLYKKGARSPIIYLEAYKVLEKEPNIFCKLGSFEIQVLRFAAKYRILTKDMVKQAAYYAMKSKENYKEFLPVLEFGYEQYGLEDCLLTICSVLIQNTCTDSKYFMYFEDAVLKNLRITRLYEYYMFTVDIRKEAPLPKAVMLFFSYNCELDYERKAYLYANVFRQKEEIQGVYDSYERQIPLFVKEQIKKCHINKDLLFLYENFLEEIPFDEEMATDFVHMVFKQKIYIMDENVRNVVVIHEQLKEENVYPVSDNRVYASLYTKESCVLLEDAEHNRTILDETDNGEPQLLFKKLVYLIDNFQTNHLGFLLYLCENKKMYSVIDSGNVHAYTTLLLDADVDPLYKQSVSGKLLRFYYDNDYMEELSDIIKKIKYSNIKSQERSEVVRYMVVLGLWEQAYEFVMTYGFETIASQVLVRICDYKLETKGEQTDFALVQLCYYVFGKGKYSEKILTYLLKYFDGTMKQMKDIWSAGLKMELDTTEIERRILSQFLHCGGYLSKKENIFGSYLEHSCDADDLIRAYIAKNCYDYFVKDYIVGEQLFEGVLKLFQIGETLPKVCKLAFIKHYSRVKQKNKKISPEEQQCIVLFLNELIEGKMFFSFFFAFKEWVPMMLTCVERTYVEYRAQPGCKVMIHYLIGKEGKVVSDYKQEMMREVFDGYYIKSFSLFFSEQLQYYITKEQDGVQSLVESGQVEKLDASDMQKETRFSLLNDMLVSEALQDYDTTTQLMAEYSNKVWLSEAFLKLM